MPLPVEGADDCLHCRAWEHASKQKNCTNEIRAELVFRSDDVTLLNNVPFVIAPMNGGTKHVLYRLNGAAVLYYFFVQKMASLLEAIHFKLSGMLPS